MFNRLNNVKVILKSQNRFYPFLSRFALPESTINGAGSTVAILMQDGHTRSAARHCADLAYGGYDDWYLPAKGELNQVYINRATINAVAIANGGESFVSSSYWSSTRFDMNRAWYQNFANGTQDTTHKIFGIGGHVRHIRTF